MLEEAVAQGRAGDAATAREDVWSPQINIGSSVLIPEGYVTDLSVRLGLYRRIATLEERREIDAFAAELVDRFGPLPPEVEKLLEDVAIQIGRAHVRTPVTNAHLVFRTLRETNNTQRNT